MKIYFISGLGSNKKAFERLEIPKDFEPIFIDWKKPEPNESFEHYSLRITEKINHNQPFYMVGLSYGGIVAQEVNAFYNPLKTILISTVMHRSEMSKFLRILSKVPIYKTVPIKFFTSEKVMSYSFFRNLYDPRLPKLNQYFTEKDPFYLRWSINKIVNWYPKDLNANKIYRMHGDSDIIFPASSIKQADFVKGGNHLMIIQKPKRVNELFNQYLIK